MLFQLIKKEVLLAKSSVLLMLAVCVAFPPFLLWRSPEQAGILGFVLSAVISVLMCLQYVSLKETQYPKAAALLCALPFSRRDLVLSKYLFSILIYLASCLIFGVETLFFPQLATVGIETPVLLFFAISCFWPSICRCSTSWDMRRRDCFSLCLSWPRPFYFPGRWRGRARFSRSLCGTSIPCF